MRPKIAVIGAGIIGVSTALRILHALPQAEVAIFCERSSPDTTSDVAGGLWVPAYLSDTPKEHILAWSKETYDYLTRMAISDAHSASYGVFLSPGFELFSVDDPGPILWSHIPIGFRKASPQELAMFPSRIKSGFYFVTTVAEGSKFIPHLTAQFKALGGKVFDNHRVESFPELQRLGYKHIVNCSGLGSVKLCNDKSMFPIRGQLHRIQAPWMKFWFASDDGSYCLLNKNFVILGGVAQKNNWDMSVSQRDKESILARNYAMWPSLKQAPLLTDLVGLRPGRNAVRLEREEVRDSNGDVQYTVYHNYGHGGSGVTLFWGCARKTAELLQRDLRQEFPTPRL